jgi:hypothetical protein
MKRILYIAAVFSGLVLVSCSKENIQPNPSSAQDMPVWRSSSSPSDNGGGIVDDGTITDPNNDRDENGRKKPNQN